MDSQENQIVENQLHRSVLLDHEMVVYIPEFYPIFQDFLRYETAPLLEILSPGVIGRWRQGQVNEPPWRRMYGVVRVHPRKWLLHLLPASTQ